MSTARKSTVRDADPIDLGHRYLMIAGLPVIARGRDVVQIGGETSRSVLLHRAPTDAVAILRHLDGSRTLGAVLQQYRADPAAWARLLSALRDAGLLVPVADWSFPGLRPGPHLEPERDSLVHRHGVAVARLVMQARQDAMVVVRGTGRLATSIATSMAVSGLGHVHQQPDRALRSADLPESQVPPRPTAGDRAHGSAELVGTPTRVDASALAANLHRSAPNVDVHPPVANHRVSLVVLAGDGPPAPSLAAELTGQRVPHLAVHAGLISAVVGPFVLPGRSSCLLCALRRRTERDPGRAAVEAGLRLEILVPPTQLVAAASALAVADALDHIDGITTPSTVDGTVEWRLGNLAPRRRSWSRHPDCGCSGPDTSPTTDFPQLTGGSG